jgi:hypothetical protein
MLAAVRCPLLVVLAAGIAVTASAQDLSRNCKAVEDSNSLLRDGAYAGT